jgi:hypothetical protein
MDPHEPLEVYSTNNANQAELIRSMLEGEGIRATLEGENQAGLAGIGMFEIKVVVSAEDRVRARQFIEDHLENG